MAQRTGLPKAAITTAGSRTETLAMAAGTSVSDEFPLIWLISSIIHKKLWSGNPNRRTIIRISSSNVEDGRTIYLILISSLEDRRNNHLVLLSNLKSRRTKYLVLMSDDVDGRIICRVLASIHDTLTSLLDSGSSLKSILATGRVKPMD
jgi:hypothetical protein